MEAMAQDRLGITVIICAQGANRLPAHDVLENEFPLFPAMR
jgi:hypothetical protein